MPFSRLFRKFSQPSLARTGSADKGRNSEHSDDSPQPTTRRSWKKTASTANRSTSSSLMPTFPLTHSSKSPAPEVCVPEQPTPMPLPTIPDIFYTNLALVPHPEAMKTTSPVPDSLTEAWDVVKDGPKDSDVTRSFNAVDDAVATVKSNVAPFQPLITAAKGAVEQTDLGKAVKEGIDHFFEGMPIFMSALDAVADLHPFIGVIVVAFKTVYTLELKRRDNEKKIIALYVEMKDMMGVLLLLKDVHNDKLVAPDGRSIEDRLRSLINRTVDDIKLCSNVCDTYAKKKLLAKVFLGPVWDDKLLGYVTLFSKRRQEFEFELSIHTSQGVDKANFKLDNIGDTTSALDEKMNVMMAMFQQLVSPEQKSLAELVAAKGGAKALRNNDKMLLSLEQTASKAPSAPSSEGHRMNRSKPSDANTNADDLRKDIFEDPDAAADKNRTVFFRKFEVQKRQIIDELTLVVTRESDRVIQVVKGGPHERILDRSIHEIWKEMGWRGNVKARHFVLTFRDYYLEKLASETQGVRGVNITSIYNSQDPDAWAIKFIDVTRLQPILEAFDDDASGFITITEMNRFTSSRPADWSLPHWVAFWAVGYKASIIDYANKIEELLAKMEGIRAEVLPPNRKSIDEYFTYSWKFIHTLTAAVTPLLPEPGTSNLDRFRSYLEAEDARLSTNLKAVDYIIDGTDTLTLIMGVGRIEKTIFPLIYLLMKRHYEIMRAMRTKILDPRELGSGIGGFYTMEDAIRYRMDDLTNIFSHQKLDPEKQFKNFAYGIFKYIRNGNDLWSSSYVRTLDPPVIPYDDSNEDQDVRLGDILKHEYKDELALEDWVYDGHSIVDTPDYGDVEPPLKDILGYWHGYFYEGNGARETSGHFSMITFVIEPADGERKFKANAWSIGGRHTITGSWSNGENGATEIKFMTTFENVSWPAISFSGRFDAERDALTGIWGWGFSVDAEISSGLMEFRRIPPRYLTVYPSIKELSDNKSRALWGFAIAAVRNDVLRERWSWSYFLQRRKDRETVISLASRCFFLLGTPVNYEEAETFSAAAQRLTAADACFWISKISCSLAYTPLHLNNCDCCRGTIVGTRLVCLDCEQKDTEIFNPLDLCCAQECMAARVTHRQDLKVPHEPSHRLVKVRPAILKRQLGRVQTAALAAFERVKTLCAKIAESSQGLVEKGEGDATGLNKENPSTTEPTLKETPSEPDDGQPKDAPDDTTVEAEDDEGTFQGLGDESPQDGARSEDNDLPSCGKCEGRLSFPCWYCIYCEDNLFLCDACDREGVPELMRSSGKHTEDHHLIRCLEPVKEDDRLSSTEWRIISLEDRLNNMQSRFDDLSQDLTSRIGNIEQLLHKLSAAVTAGSSA
ncbi:hypothetical protein EDB92DRAFT_1948471 [Lactarius akahatsu]|uniref:EF-hand domain-containing protein n=1 Tax=Lactarius akahatsu TaxID=416441 RepID=A0AAD4LC84_9AGAM|nr:hypothetical protein EDB92DRAFT_1948471 [Lactarius akahatsu]